VRQNGKCYERLEQFLDAVHPAKDSQPYENANAPAPTDRCNRAGARSNEQENRSEDNIHYLATERLQSDICRVHRIHRKAHIDSLFVNPDMRRLSQGYRRLGYDSVTQSTEMRVPPLTDLLLPLC
jgi:hypothetical protein